MLNIQETTYFTSITYGKIQMSSVIWKILSYIAQDPRANYEIAVGTDSMTRGNETKYAVAITVHREYHGAIFFYKTINERAVKSLDQKLHKETELSMDVAEYLIKALGSRIMNTTSNVHLVIHMDIGENGPTSRLIAELEGWVSAMGYDYRIKPESYASSTIADRISK